MLTSAVPFILIPGVMMRRVYYILLVFLVPLLHLCYTDAPAQELDRRTVATGLSVPWEIIWGPDNWIWMTERGGAVSRVNPESGEKRLLLTIPGVHQIGEGGLLGMALHPNFADTAWVFVVYNYQEANQTRERLVRYTYNGTTLVDPTTLVEGIAGSSIHNGSRLLITPDRILYMTTGDAANAPIAQNHSSLNGKILRMRLDGSVPPDNPYPNAPAPFNLIYTTGHRNPQGLVLGSNGIMYSSEHGPNADDEINIIDGSGNFGWPNVHGQCDIPGEMQFCQDSSVVEAIKAWTPTIATAGLEYYNHPLIPQWNNSLLLTTLKEQDLRVLKLSPDGRSIVGETILFDKDYGRLRDLCIAPDGRVFFSTSERSGGDMIIEVKPFSAGATEILSVTAPENARLGELIDISFTTQGTFAVDNVFFIEISSPHGSFDPFTIHGITFPYLLGAFQATTGGTYSVKIPCADRPFTTSHKIRVRSTSPADTSSEFGPSIDLAGKVEVPIAITPSGPLTACVGDSIVLAATPGMTGYLWSNGATTSTIVLKETVFAISLTATDSNGCLQRSTTLQVLFNVRPEPVIQQTGAMLTTDQVYASYQWKRDGEPIPGATERTYTPVAGGEYSVEVISTEGCSGTSAAFPVTISSVGQNNELTKGLSISPQPARDRAAVALDLAKGGKLEILVRDIRGTTVARFEDDASAGTYQREISTADLAPGVYLVTVTVGGKSGQIKLVKE